MVLLRKFNFIGKDDLILTKLYGLTLSSIMSRIFGLEKVNIPVEAIRIIYVLRTSELCKSY